MRTYLSEIGHPAILISLFLSPIFCLIIHFAITFWVIIIEVCISRCNIIGVYSNTLCHYKQCTCFLSKSLIDIRVINYLLIFLILVGSFLLSSFQLLLIRELISTFHGVDCIKFLLGSAFFSILHIRIEDIGYSLKYTSRCIFPYGRESVQAIKLSLQSLFLYTTYIINSSLQRISHLL